MKHLIIALNIFSGIASASPQGFPVVSQYTVSTSSVEALASNKNRGYLLIQNNGTGNCWAKFGASQSGLEGVVIGSSQNYEVVNGYIKSSVYMRCAASGSSIVFVETNY